MNFCQGTTCDPWSILNLDSPNLVSKAADSLQKGVCCGSVALKGVILRAPRSVCVLLVPLGWEEGVSKRSTQLNSSSLIPTDKTREERASVSLLQDNTLMWLHVGLFDDSWDNKQWNFAQEFEFVRPMGLFLMFERCWHLWHLGL